MFNLGGFNQMPFNRAFSIDIYGSFVVDMRNDVIMNANVVMSPVFDVDLSLETIFGAVTDKLGTYVIDLMNQNEFEAIRFRNGSFDLTCNTEVTFNAARFHVDEIQFTGSFTPGDQIVINSKMLTFTLNGDNNLQTMQGDFFDLNLGGNEITYTDSATGRSVLMRVTYRDKFV